ncbi:Ras family protein, partial [Entamoeba invadens IP1]
RIYKKKKIDSNEHIPIIICGNKCDLELNRIVTTDKGETLANSMNIQFFETSAKNDINVENVFCALLKAVLKKKQSFQRAKNELNIQKSSEKNSCTLI